jgi:hypothetical protein
LVRAFEQCNAAGFCHGESPGNGMNGIQRIQRERQMFFTSV